MARARLLKPSFFLNSDLGRLPMGARLAFEGLWTVADREGRLVDDPLRLKAEILPYDRVDMNRFLDQLAAAGFIVRFESGGCRYIQVVNFTKHQNPHVREPASTIPAPGEHGARTVPEQGETGTGPARSGVLIRSLDPVLADSARAREPLSDPVAQAIERAGIELSPFVRDDLAAWEAEHVPRNWILHGIRVAGEGQKPWSYARKVVETTIRNGGLQEGKRDRSQQRRGPGDRPGTGHDPAERDHDPYCLECHHERQLAAAKRQ